MLRSPGVKAGETATSQDAKAVLTWGFQVEESDGEGNPTAMREVEDREFELEQSSDRSFADPVVRYRGPNQTSVLTGLAEGDYYFRVREHVDGREPSAWSEPLHVRVVYMPREQVFLFIGIGLTVVLITIGAILYGHFRGSDPNLVESS